MGRKLFILSFLVFSFAMTACGEKDTFVSAFDRQVESGSGNTQPSQPNREPAAVSEGTDQVFEDNQDVIVEPTISLFEKVLQNSDVSEVALQNAFEFYDDNHQIIENQEWITIFDIGQHSGNRRMFVINMNSGDVRAIHTTHGKKSDLDHDGIATEFSNVNGSNKSSLGFMLTAETYFGRHGYSMRLDGLESRNSNVRTRAIVVHGADYVSPDFTKMGRSLGCPAISWDNRDWLIDTIKQGSLFYIFHEDYDA